jgi:hypothetical protein
MSKLKPPSDTTNLSNPVEQEIAEVVKQELELEGSDNDELHNQFVGGDQVDSLGDGIPGYETTGVDGTDDQIEQEETATSIPKLRPRLYPPYNK